MSVRGVEQWCVLENLGYGSFIVIEKAPLTDHIILQDFLSICHCKYISILYIFELFIVTLTLGAVVQWQSIGLVTERLRVRLTLGLLQATLSKLLTYCVLKPTQPPTPSGTGNEQQLRLRGEGLVWLIGAMVCLLAAPLVKLSVSAGNGWPHNALRHHWLIRMASGINIYSFFSDIQKIILDIRKRICDI